MVTNDVAGKFTLELKTSYGWGQCTACLEIFEFGETIVSFKLNSNHWIYHENCFEQITVYSSAFLEARNGEIASRQN